MLEFSVFIVFALDYAEQKRNLLIFYKIFISINCIFTWAHKQLLEEVVLFSGPTKTWCQNKTRFMVPESVLSENIVAKQTRV